MSYVTEEEAKTKWCPTDTTFLAALWALERTRDVALEIADRSYAEYAARKEEPTQ